MAFSILDSNLPAGMARFSIPRHRSIHLSTYTPVNIPRFFLRRFLSLLRPTKLCVVGSFSLSLSLLNGQVSLSIQKTEALIGDQLELTLQINTPSDMEWLNPDVVPADTVSSIEVVRTGDVQQSAAGTYKQYLKTWTIAVFDTGLVRIPPVPVILQSPLGNDTQYTNDIPLIISGITDSLGLAPIKPIIREPAKLSDYLSYIIVIAALIALVILAIWYRKRKPKETAIIEIRDEKPAHIIALEQLDTLEREKLWQQGLIKEYHSRMNYIMREYLERRFQIPARESTSGEIMEHLRKGALPENLLHQIREVMTVEDLIKFAKAEPPIDIHAQYLEFARALILQTKDELQIHHADG